MVHVSEFAQLVYGIIGCVISSLISACPAPLLWNSLKNKTVNGLNPEPQVATIMKCLFWLFFGLPMVHHDVIRVVSNGIGLLMPVLHLTLYVIFSPRKTQLRVAGCVFIELTFMAAIAVVAILKFPTTASRSDFIGPFCVVFGVVKYSSTLAILLLNIRSARMVDMTTGLLSLANFVDVVIWIVYAALKFSKFALISDGVGVLFGTVQLAVSKFYYFK